MQKPNDPKLFLMSIKHYVSNIMPFISLQDGGFARGKMYGLVKQLGGTIPDLLLRNKTMLNNEKFSIDSRKLNDGIRAGMSIRRTNIYAEITNVIMSQANHQKMYQALKNLKALQSAFIELINERLKKA